MDRGRDHGCRLHGVSTMNLHVFDTKEAASMAAAEHVAALIQRQPRVTLGLATGSTPILFYTYLHQLRPAMKHVQSFNLDEYVGVPSHHPASFYQYMQTHYVIPFQLQDHQVHRPSGELAPTQALAAYRQALQGVTIDMQLLGIGTNGHIGFNEPGCDFDNDVHIETLDASTKQANQAAFGSPNLVPDFAITMGIKSILAAKQIVLLAFGDTKANVVAQMIQGPVTNQLPASVLQQHPNVHVYLDRAAAAKLT